MRPGQITYGRAARSVYHFGGVRRQTAELSLTASDYGAAPALLRLPFASVRGRSTAKEEEAMAEAMAARAPKGGGGELAGLRHTAAASPGLEDTPHVVAYLDRGSVRLGAHVPGAEALQAAYRGTARGGYFSPASLFSTKRRRRRQPKRRRKTRRSLNPFRSLFRRKTPTEKLVDAAVGAAGRAKDLAVVAGPAVAVMASQAGGRNSLWGALTALFAFQQ